MVGSRTSRAAAVIGAVVVAAIVAPACTAVASEVHGARSVSGVSATVAAVDASSLAVVGPPTGVTFDYQLGGAYDPADGVAVVATDASDAAFAGYAICYLNGFQTQPDEKKDWFREAPELILRTADGTPIGDPDWPGEYLLDIRTAEKRAGIVDRLGPRIAQCASDGYDAVEMDNLDTFTRTKKISRDDAVAMAQLYVVAAHEAGLAIAQKNAAQQSAIFASEAGFDFAVTEECAKWSECRAYTKVYGDAVYDIEYASKLTKKVKKRFRARCADPASPLSMILRDPNLKPSTSAKHIYRACPIG